MHNSNSRSREQGAGRRSDAGTGGHGDAGEKQKRGAGSKRRKQEFTTAAKATEKIAPQANRAAVCGTHAPPLFDLFSVPSTVSVVLTRSVGRFLAL
jgi:hypothetical protein